MASLKMGLILSMLVFTIVSANLVGTTHGIRKAQENANADNKGNTQDIDNAQGNGYTQAIGTVQQAIGIEPDTYCCFCKIILCCPCHPPSSSLQ